MPDRTVPSFTSQPVALLDGSLPDGGTVANTPIHGVDCAPYLDDSEQRAGRVSRTDIDLGGKFAFILDDVLDPSEADTMIAITEALGYQPEAPGIMTAPGLRQNKSVHWVPDQHTMRVIFDRMKRLLPQEMEGDALSPKLSQRLNMYRYDLHDVFNPHIDGDWPGYGLSEDRRTMIQWPGVFSKLTMILYLNGAEDGVEGGETVLYDQGEIRAAVKPKKGRALFFRHGHSVETVLHAGAPVLGPVSKYVARINVLFDQSENYHIRNFGTD
jgi:hypothetical protein